MTSIRMTTNRSFAHRVACNILFFMGVIGVAQAAEQPVGFKSVINKELDGSTQHWPDPKVPPEGTPNILVWVIDDAGIGHIGSFGGVIETPNLDRLAQRGLRFSNFHATPVCSASRAALLTGRNPHKVHIGSHAGGAVGFPGYDAHIPSSMATIAAIMQKEGFSTFAIGKWDHLPTEDTSPAGPFDYWPSGQGFDRFYGFLAADTDNFEPTLWSDHSPVDYPREDVEYHLSKDMANKAIDWISARSLLVPAPPFFLYWATGAIHAPHHAPDDMLRHYRGRFDAGWDVMRAQILERQKELGIVPENTELPPRPEGMPAWDSLGDRERTLYARAMEALAAQMTYTDQQFGRILEHLEETGELDNTIVVVVSDNGASAEGGLYGAFSEHLFFNNRYSRVEENLEYLDIWGQKGTYPHVPLGWAVAANTPFRYYKQTAYEGGTRVPMILSFPNGMSRTGEVRDQFHFISDITPTLLTLVGIAPPEKLSGVTQEPFDGVDMTYLLEDGHQASRRTVQYFEIMGNRAIYQDGWKAVNGHRTKTWELPEHSQLHDKWELYHVAEDINELEDLAETHGEKLEAMKQLFDREARDNNVYPIGSSPGHLGRLVMEREMKQLQQRGGVFKYTSPISRIPETLAPRVSNSAYELKAEVTVSSNLKPADVNGPIFAVGGNLGGVTLFLSEGRVHYLYRNVDNSITHLASQQTLPAGDAIIEISYKPQGKGAVGTMRVNDKTVGDFEVQGPLARAFSLHETFDVGMDSGTLVAEGFEAAHELTVELKELQVRMLPH